jgi:cation diffusion facilitator family transporter
MLTKKQAAGLSVFSNASLTLLKLAVGILSGSMSIVAEAAHSGIDLIASFVAYFSVRVSDRPADREHPYGHGKIENISGILEGGLIFLISVWIIAEAAQKLRSGVVVHYIPIGIGIMVVSLAVNALVSRLLYRIAYQTRSIALEADAVHLHSDVLTSIGVIATLAVIYIARVLWQVDLSFLDPVFSVLIALFILRLGWKLTKKSYPGLLDERVNPEVEEQIRAIIRSFCSDCYNYHRLRTRQAGSKIHIDFHLEVSPEISIENAHQLSHDLSRVIEEKIADSEVIVHVEPLEKDRSAYDDGF